MTLEEWKHVGILNLIVKPHSAELILSGLIGTANHPNLQKIQIIGFFFENKLHW